jgi:hypothetical protein
MFAENQILTAFMDKNIENNRKVESIDTKFSIKTNLTIEESTH